MAPDFLSDFQRIIILLFTLQNQSLCLLESTQSIKYSFLTTFQVKSVKIQDLIYFLC